MDSLNAYLSSSEEDIDLPKELQPTHTTNTNNVSTSPQLQNNNKLSIIAAPSVDTLTCKPLKYHNPNTIEILHNPRADILFAPISGPLRKNCNSRDDEFRPSLTTLTGHVEFHSMSNYSFDEQYHTYHNFGYAINPSKGIDVDMHITAQFIGDQQSLQRNKAMTINNQSSSMVKMKKKNRRKRLRNKDAGDIEGYLGPWAKEITTEEEKIAYDSELKERKKQWERDHPNHDQKVLERKRRRIGNKNTNDNEKHSETTEERIARKKRENEEQIVLEKSEFHGNIFRDYQSRTYMYCAPEKRRKSDRYQKYFVPKKKINKFMGHKSGVNVIKFFPNTGHLLLSGSNDNTCKIWDMFNDKQCLRTYDGHTAGVRNLMFSKNGSKFLTTSYDRWIKLWDTEKGSVIWRGTSGKVPFDATFYPENENQFMCGQKNKIAVQWDMRSNRIVQVYEEHLSAVNTITFIDHNRRFVTSSDDKKIFIWDYGTPVVIKHISEPQLHSVPFISLHPNKKWMVGQSMDNTIVVYSAINRFRYNNNKHFTGHLNAGYACEVSVSYDGQIVMSGDAHGHLYFWDWKTSRFYGKLKAHSQVTMGCIWHPVLQSRVASCSWDGSIILWD